MNLKSAEMKDLANLVVTIDHELDKDGKKRNYDHYPFNLYRGVKEIQRKVQGFVQACYVPKDKQQDQLFLVEDLKWLNPEKLTPEQNLKPYLKDGNMIFRVTEGDCEISEQAVTAFKHFLKLHKDQLPPNLSEETLNIIEGMI